MGQLMLTHNFVWSSIFLWYCRVFMNGIVIFDVWLQVALLKEERSNLMVENEELYGKVREAQTLSRKDSVKAKQLETEVDHLKDEFDRLRLLYESTRDHMDNIEVCNPVLLVPSFDLICKIFTFLNKETNINTSLSKTRYTRKKFP